MDREESLFIKDGKTVLGLYRRDPADGIVKCYSLVEKNLDQIEEMHRSIEMKYAKTKTEN